MLWWRRKRRGGVWWQPHIVIMVVVVWGGACSAMLSLKASETCLVIFSGLSVWLEFSVVLFYLLTN